MTQTRLNGAGGGGRAAGSPKLLDAPLAGLPGGGLERQDGGARPPGLCGPGVRQQRRQRITPQPDAVERHAVVVALAARASAPTQWKMITSA